MPKGSFEVAPSPQISFLSVYFFSASCRFERPVANALEQFKQLKPTREMFDSCRNCGALQEGHENASKLF